MIGLLIRVKTIYTNKILSLDYITNIDIMKYKLILLFSALFWFTLSVKAQQLSLEETIGYINSHLETGDYISLDKSGIFQFSYYSNYRRERGSWKHHITNVKRPDKIQYNASKWSFTLKDLDGGLVVSLTTETGDKYSVEKLFNAFNHFYTLAMDIELMKQKQDDDPFAPSNYNPQAFSIKSTLSNGSIPLEKEGSVYYVLVKIGDIEKKFILDSGASEVLISPQLELDLTSCGIIRKENYLTPALYRVADGRIIEQRRLIIPRLTIGDFTIENVRAAVGVGAAPLLLGKSVLDKFSKWSINNLTSTLDVAK